MANYLVPILVGLVGLAVMLGPDAWKFLKGILSKPASPLDPNSASRDLDGELVFDLPEPVVHLAHLLELRKFLHGNTEALEVIDTILAPSIMKAGGVSHEGE